ncbi:hypothetical protein C0993_008983 [Termitomyces sp. T159_Od127]|nr:hypothetical protein C0993_008983 [Termitomyces sp. T159_Od127]
MSQQPSTTALDLNNIQGDILTGIPKKTQTYFFFAITDVKLFRSQLAHLVPLIKTTSQALDDRKKIDDHKKKGNKTLIKMVGVNIAFSHKGFKKLEIDDTTLRDERFREGQKQGAKDLLDKGTESGSDFVPNWEPEFLQDIHAVILISGDSHETVGKKFDEVKSSFGISPAHQQNLASIKEVTTIRGDVRPGKESGREHFGFLDGISNPSVIGFDNNPIPGTRPVRAGVVVTGHEGDPNLSPRPTWTMDGSYLTFRYLFQQVPEFNKFLADNPIPLPGLTPKEGSELLGARLMGRWKSGAPIDLSPFQDDPELAKDPKRVNNFRYQAEGTFQKMCPFAAHIRKTNPRADLEDFFGINAIENNRIVRRGVQFGPELTKDEIVSNKTAHARGLLFVCYSSSIENGFAFIQRSKQCSFETLINSEVAGNQVWANSANFPPNAGVDAGLDPIIGQGKRTMVGTDPNNPDKELSLPDFVIPRGGEYFFSPSIKSLKEALATA